MPAILKPDVDALGTSTSLIVVSEDKFRVWITGHYDATAELEQHKDVMKKAIPVVEVYSREEFDLRDKILKLMYIAGTRCYIAFMPLPDDCDHLLCRVNVYYPTKMLAVAECPNTDSRRMSEIFCTDVFVFVASLDAPNISFNPETSMFKCEHVVTKIHYGVAVVLNDHNNSHRVGRDIQRTKGDPAIQAMIKDMDLGFHRSKDYILIMVSYLCTNTFLAQFLPEYFEKVKTIGVGCAMCPNRAIYKCCCRKVNYCSHYCRKKYRLSHEKECYEKTYFEVD
jgi:hypothetical protein